VTKPTLPQLSKYGFWLLPILILPLPIWGLIQWRGGTEPNYAVTPKPLVSPSPTFSTFPFLKDKSGSTPLVPASPQPKPSTKAVPPTLSKAELARRSAMALAAMSPNVDSSVELHVAIASGAPALTVSVSGSGKLFDQNGTPLQTLKAGQNYTVQAGDRGMSFAGAETPRIAWVVPDSKSVVYVGERGYHGTLLLVADGGKLWAVNYVNLRQYLYSVVGAEVSPSWPMAALKAQAIAARSYALTYYFKPANKLYHLGSDEYFQVYKGIESEANTTYKAVDETAGSFVSYRGGIVESLYAASDDIVAEAFQGHGMSQLGALSLAEKGYTHEQILKNYYPKTGVGRIEIDPE
jgi:stage II sporulation protein D